MSLNIIKEISERLKESKSPSLYLLNINITDDIGYSALQIELGTDLKEFIDDLSKSFAKKIQQFQNVVEYNGSAQNNFIYKISSSNHFFSSIQKKIEIIKKKMVQS